MKLLHEIESYGAGVEREGEQLRLINGKLLPDSLLKLVKEKKAELVAGLARDEVARSSGFLPLQSGEIYEYQLSKDMHVFIMSESTESSPNSPKWSACRESFKDGKSVSIKRLADKVNTFDMALMEASKYVGFMRRDRK